MKYYEHLGCVEGSNGNENWKGNIVSEEGVLIRKVGRSPRAEQGKNISRFNLVDFTKPHWKEVSIVLEIDGVTFNIGTGKITGESSPEHERKFLKQICDYDYIDIKEACNKMGINLIKRLGEIL